MAEVFGRGSFHEVSGELTQAMEWLRMHGVATDGTRIAEQLRTVDEIRRGYNTDGPTVWERRYADPGKRDRTLVLLAEAVESMRIYTGLRHDSALAPPLETLRR